MLKQGFVVDQTYQNAFHLHIHLIMELIFVRKVLYKRAQIDIETKSNMKIVDCFGSFVQKCSAEH